MSRVIPYSGKFCLVTTGDSLIFQKISIFKEEKFLEIRNIIREADVAFNNFETIIPKDKGYPRHKTDPTAWMRSPKYVVEELKWMGFNLFSLANNHSMDYSEGGLMETIKIFEEAGLTHAGTGRNLSDARAPAYLNTEKARVALVACNTRDEDGPAGDPWGPLQGRPGLNPQRSKRTVFLREPEFNKLTEVSKALCLAGPRDNSMNFLGIRVKLGEEAKLHTDPYKPDFDGNLVSIKEAKKNADLVFVSIHNHDKRSPGVSYFDDKIEYIAEHVETFSRAAVDAGADAVLGHGTHTLNGIEIYEGRPIFYGLGNFISQSYQSHPKPYDYYEARGLHEQRYPEVTPRQSGSLLSEAEQEQSRLRMTTSVVAKLLYDEGRVKEILLYPILLRRDFLQGGRPFLATGEDAQEILERLSRLSSDYGTEIAITDGVGKITARAILKK